MEKTIQHIKDKIFANCSVLNKTWMSFGKYIFKALQPGTTSEKGQSANNSAFGHAHNYAFPMRFGLSKTHLNALKSNSSSIECDSTDYQELTESCICTHMPKPA